MFTGVCSRATHPSVLFSKQTHTQSSWAFFGQLKKINSIQRIYSSLSVFSGGKPQLRDGRSYSDVVGKSIGGGGPSWVQQPEFIQRHEKYVVVPDKTGAFSSLFGLALVGRVVNLETLVDFDKLLSIAKVSVANIQYMGGLSLLISFHDVEAAKKFLDSKVIWGPWFLRLEPWNGQTFPMERVAWLRIIGIPIHLFDPEVMVQIGEQFGKVLHSPKFVEEDSDVSVCSVAVLVGDVGRINGSVKLFWNNKSYRIWVEEELEVWVPDCLLSSGRDDVGPELSSPVVNMQSSGSGGGKRKWRRSRGACWSAWELEES
ncbi:hypothetical protein HanPI659440_Chr03g0100171 [Helianthus annuus]|nr:hypothetical protein HanPI659440_Chr03g0100171 [Helianthus annuus]